MFFQVGRWIDQLICGDAGRVAEEKVHYAQAEFCVRSRKYSRWRNCEIRQQPNRTGRGRSSDLVDDRFHLIAWKAIEEEMRHDDIVRMWRPPVPNVGVNELNARPGFGITLARAGPGKRQHALARIDTVDVDLRMNAQQFAKKTAIAFAKDEHALRARDCLEAPEAGTLQGLTERDGFKQSKRAGDAIEAHRRLAINEGKQLD